MEYVQLAFLIIIKVIATLMSPYGMNQLLRCVPWSIISSIVLDVFCRYLESGGEGAVVRPWVWITYLFLGPALGTIAFQWYIFIMVSSS